MRLLALVLVAAPSLALAATSPPAPPPAAAAATPAPAPRLANTNPDDDLLVAPPAPLEGCEAKLKARGVKFSSAVLPVHEVGKKKKKLTCGAEQVVVYHGSATAKIRYEPSPLVTCSMALALSRFDEIAAEESERVLGKRIVKIRQLGTYACREMANYPGWVSEHSYANAIDLETFVLSDGREISVLRDFDRRPAGPAKKGGVLLQTLARRAYDEDLFSSVLTPHFDALHRNHFHVDLARYRTDGTRP